MTAKRSLTRFKPICRLLHHAETLLELIHTSAGINEFLLARKEGMALGADFNLNIVLGGTRGVLCAARALYGNNIIFRMNTLFHFSHLITLVITVRPMIPQLFQKIKCF